MPLTSRQHDIAVLVLRGHSNEDIANALRKRYPGLTGRTVRSEVNAIRQLLPGPLPARQRIIRHYSEAK